MVKTNVKMLSETDRNLFGIVIRQDTKDCMLSLTDLQEAYTRARVLNGWSNKGKIQDIIALKENSERIYYLLKEQKIINSEISDFMEIIEKQGVVKTLKSLGVYRTSGRGDNKQTMCNPYIWVLVAMELNPMLYAKVVMWLTDKLILNRIEAGDMYKELCCGLARFEKPDYSAVAKAINTKVIGRHELGIRNKASAEELKKIRSMEENLAYAIRKGWLKSNEEVLKEIQDY